MWWHVQINSLDSEFGLYVNCTLNVVAICIVELHVHLRTSCRLGKD